MSGKRVYILGGYQTDFKVNWTREGKDIFDLLTATVEGAFNSAKIELKDVEVAHIGNFVGEIGSRQGLLGGMFATIHPDLANVPAIRHEAACASGSIAVLSAAADIESGRFYKMNISFIIGV